MTTPVHGLTTVGALTGPIGTAQTVSMASPMAFADFLTAAQAPEVPNGTALDWRTYMRRVLNDDDLAAQRRLDALRKKDPALAARMAAILKLPVWLQHVTLADIHLSQVKREAMLHPDRPERAAYRNKLRVAVSGGQVNSIFDATEGAARA